MPCTKRPRFVDSGENDNSLFALATELKVTGSMTEGLKRGWGFIALEIDW